MVFGIRKISGKDKDAKINRINQRHSLNPILDGVRAHPILDGEGAKKPPPQVNSAIWCLTTMKLGRNTV